MTQEKSQNSFDVSFMRFALEVAREGADVGEIPVGAVVVCNNKIIARSHNAVERDQDSTCHAEIVAIREASRVLQTKNLSGCGIYVTLEPCAMCASAISYSRISRLYYGAEDKKFGAIDNGSRIFNSNSSLFIPEVYGGILEEECGYLIREFFSSKRSKNY